MQKITPFLWFDNQAEEAANFYVSVFKDAKIRWSESRMQAAISLDADFPDAAHS
jgi:predicted 3-demethylubiquinone-9 3-methyltransferase (glyoxalase superfamily)